jgi:cyclopropane fatty-acyl-phospholipid synthase-like methyltransferase
MVKSKKHWEKIYEKKELNGVSWFQEKPSTSLSLIDSSSIKKDNEIIDIGCGKSYLIDNLLKNQFSDISILDISSNALKEVKKRISKYTNKGELFNSNILDFYTDKKFDLWHDRAVFHFLTIEKEIRNYIEISENQIRKGGTLIIGTFSENGPLKCSGLEISRYSVDDLKLLFSESFELVEHLNTDHATPFDTIQNFNFCRFKKLK